MRYYSTKGDKGTTSFGHGRQASKAGSEVEYVGALDEAQAALGFAAVEARLQEVKWSVAAAETKSANTNNKQLALDFRVRSALLRDICTCLKNIQRTVFESGLIVMDTASEELIQNWSWVTQTTKIENLCEDFAPQQTLKGFVLPGGSELAARIELARVALRRLERAFCQFSTEGASDVDTLAFYNRLSSLAFILARRSNEILEVSETTL